ncbi:MAG: hypothetical protein CML66_28350 [Rhodobacteraceae bacterium]|nr:hypothetical protein [Paracoccaceae bacterium]MAY47771.1 hypothetical protein [Paracoccaceae bacterium]
MSETIPKSSQDIPARPGVRGRARQFQGVNQVEGRKTIVYILGSSRSGTSALRNAVAQTRYNGFGESHIEPLLSQIVSTVRGYGGARTTREDKLRRQGRKSDAGTEQRKPPLGNARDTLDADALLRHLFRGYECYMTERKRSHYLIDKTPSARIIRAVPMLNRYHEDPRFTFCSRRHVDNIQSKLKKFSDTAFVDQCKAWAACNQAWLQVRDRLRGNCLAFDFHDLAAMPEEIAARIATYLELSAEEQAAMARYLVSARPQSEDPDRDLQRYLKLSDVDWSDEDKETFRRVCGPVGEALGYGFESYFAEPDPAGASGQTPGGA